MLTAGGTEASLGITRGVIEAVTLTGATRTEGLGGTFCGVGDVEEWMPLMVVVDKKAY